MIIFRKLKMEEVEAIRRSAMQLVKGDLIDEYYMAKILPVLDHAA